MQSTPATTHIAIVSITPIENKGALRAFVSVTLNGRLTLHGCRVIQAEGKPAWIAFPQNEVPSRDGGKPRFYPVVEVLDKVLKRQIETAILEAWTAQDNAQQPRLL